MPLFRMRQLVLKPWNNKNLSPITQLRVSCLVGLAGKYSLSGGRMAVPPGVAIVIIGTNAISSADEAWVVAKLGCLVKDAAAARRYQA